MADRKPRRHAKQFLEMHPEIHSIDLLIPDMNGVIRGKRIDRSVVSKAFEQGICLPASIFSLDINGTTIEETGLGLEQGDSDRICTPLQHTFAPVPWQQRPTAQLLMTMQEVNGQPFYADPRVVLQNVLTRFNELELTPTVAVEMEFYLLDQELTSQGCPQVPRSPLSGKREHNTQVYSIADLDEYAGFLEDIIASAHAQDIPADTIIAEYAPAQFEINLHHQPDPVTACDHAILLKRVIRNVAQKHGFSATFMAKPYPEQAGNGMHIHLSLQDKYGANIFSSEGDSVNNSLSHAIAGALDTMPEAVAFFCPNVNSYRRFSPDFYVANAPTWGYDNRTTAIRIPSGPSSAKRIEHRIAGADANPYLAMSALLAGVHHGLSQKLLPPPETTGNAYKKTSMSLPDNLRDALRVLRDSEVMQGYIGRDYIETFAICKEQEMIHFEKTISHLEYDWYLNTV